MVQLNAPQQQAISHLFPPLLVIAGAGSGKTRVITEKIIHLLKNRNSPTQYIVAITFTNKAANEMRTRLRQALPNQSTKSVIISTFHSLGLMLLKQEHAFFNLNERFSIFDEADKKNILQQLTESNYPNFTDKIDFFSQHISQWKNLLLSPEQLNEQIINKDTQVAAQLYNEYSKTLTLYNAVDFDDLIYLPVLMLQSDPKKRSRWQNKIGDLLIDEYQDTNQAQYIFIKLLMTSNTTLTIVGDDDQSIYAWRGAQVENINQLKHDFQNLNIIKLEQNYRSTQRILRAANKLISHNPHTFTKKLWSNLALGDCIRIMPCESEQDEAAKTIQDLQKKIHSGMRYSQFALLYRSNHQARLFETMLREHNIPYTISGQLSFFSRTEIKDLMAYFKLMINPNDDASFLRIINTPKRSIGNSTLQSLSQYAKRRNQSLLLSSQELGLQQILSKKLFKNLNEFIQWFNYHAQQICQTTNIQPIHNFLKELHYDEWIRQQHSQQKTVKNKLKHIDELIHWLTNLLNKTPSKPFSNIIQHLSLLDILEGQQDNTQDDTVQLMTLHAAKGLEFPNVYLVGFEEEILPHHNSLEGEALNEERRLAYVGITRAQKTLTLSYANKRKKNGELVSCSPSRFLKELPKDDVTWQSSVKKYSQEETNILAKDNLAKIKAALFNEE